MDFAGLDDVAVLRESRNADSEGIQSGQISVEDVPQHPRLQITSAAQG